MLFLLINEIQRNSVTLYSKNIKKYKVFVHSDQSIIQKYDFSASVTFTNEILIEMEQTRLKD